MSGLASVAQRKQFVSIRKILIQKIAATKTLTAGRRLSLTLTFTASHDWNDALSTHSINIT